MYLRKANIDTKCGVVKSDTVGIIEAIMDERDPPVESRNEVERGTRGPIQSASAFCFFNLSLSESFMYSAIDTPRLSAAFDNSYFKYSGNTICSRTVFILGFMCNLLCMCINCAILYT